MSIATHCFVLGVALCAGPILTIASRSPVAGGVVMVVAPPWTEGEDIIASSNGRILGPATSRFATLAVSEDPAFLSRLKSNGAWIVLDANKIAELCGASE